MGIPWVLPSFKHILVDASAEFLRTTDKKKGKQRTAFIDRVTEEIRQAVADTNDPLPIDLTKVCLSLLYSGCAGTDYVSLSVHGSEMRPTDTQREAGRKHPRRIHVWRGHPIIIKKWNAKKVCGSIHADRVSKVQIRLSGGTEKQLGLYAAALKEVFGKLSKEEMEECETFADEWNKNQLSEEVQRK
jgi:hypothetical protein